MKYLPAAFAALAVLMLLLGCAMPWDAQKAPEANKTPAPNITKNETPLNGSVPEKNESAVAANETVVKKNKTVIKPVERPDPFAGIVPRNISENIADGRFRIVDQPAAPVNIYAINDGHADSILVNKGEFYMLVDAGNSAQAIDFLRSAGVRKLNVLVATRDDSGAVGGLSDVLDAYPVDEFWENGVQSNPSLVSLVPASTQYAELLAKVKEKNITVKHPQAGDAMGVSGMDVIILNPQNPRLKGNPDIDAIVMKISFNSFCALLLNPTVQERETAFMGSNESLQCDVMTYFKHGEGRSTPPLLVSNHPPKDVIIFVGENTDRLPSATTLTWLAMRNIKVWRTDKDGTIRVSSDGFTADVSSVK